MTDLMTGGCLCGAVTYEARGVPIFVGHCHCVHCRKASGTGHGTHVAMPESDVSVTGEVKSYARRADSGNQVARSCCPECGCAIYSKNTGMPGMIFLRASSLDDPDQVTPQLIVYASRAPKWDVMDASLRSFPEMPEGGAQAAMDR